MTENIVKRRRKSFEQAVRTRQKSAREDNSGEEAMWYCLGRTRIEGNADKLAMMESFIYFSNYLIFTTEDLLYNKEISCHRICDRSRHSSKLSDLHCRGNRSASAYLKGFLEEEYEMRADALMDQI